MTKEGGESYEICTDGQLPRCDCPAAMFRPKSKCRHIIAMEKVGLIPKEDKPFAANTKQ